MAYTSHEPDFEREMEDTATYIQPSERRRLADMLQNSRMQRGTSSTQISPVTSYCSYERAREILNEPNTGIVHVVLATIDMVARKQEMN